MSEADDVPPVAGTVDRSFMFRQPNRRAPGQLSIPFASRETNQCPWPEWDSSRKTGMVCGLPSDPKTRQPWCRHHHRVAYHKA